MEIVDILFKNTYACIYVRLGLKVKPHTKDKIGSLKKNLTGRGQICRLIGYAAFCYAIKPIGSTHYREKNVSDERYIKQEFKYIKTNGFITWSLEFESQPLKYNIRLGILRFRKTRISRACSLRSKRFLARFV